MSSAFSAWLWLGNVTEAGGLAVIDFFINGKDGAFTLFKYAALVAEQNVGEES